MCSVIRDVMDVRDDFVSGASKLLTVSYRHG